MNGEDARGRDAAHRIVRLATVLAHVLQRDVVQLETPVLKYVHTTCRINVEIGEMNLMCGCGWMGGFSIPPRLDSIRKKNKLSGCLLSLLPVLGAGFCFYFVSSSSGVKMAKPYSPQPESQITAAK